MNQVDNQTSTYPSFCSMKWLGVSYHLPQYQILVHRRVTPSSKTRLDTRVERSTA